jgi:hypothetical protein
VKENMVVATVLKMAVRAFPLKRLLVTIDSETSVTLWCKERMAVSDSRKYKYVGKGTKFHISPGRIGLRFPFAGEEGKELRQNAENLFIAGEYSDNPRFANMEFILGRVSMVEVELES